MHTYNFCLKHYFSILFSVSDRYYKGFLKTILKSRKKCAERPVWGAKVDKNFKFFFRKETYKFTKAGNLLLARIGRIVDKNKVSNRKTLKKYQKSAKNAKIRLFA